MTTTTTNPRIEIGDRVRGEYYGREIVGKMVALDVRKTRWSVAIYAVVVDDAGEAFGLLNVEKVAS